MRTAPLETWLVQFLQHPHRVRRGLLALLLLGLAYALSIALLAWGGVAPGMASWLAIPTAEYFRWEPYFTAPVIVLSGILAAAVLHLCARWLGGTGDFEACLALVGPLTFIATLFTLVPDTLIGFGLVIGWIDPQQWMADIVRPSTTLALIWVYLLLYVAAFLVLFPIIGRMVYALDPWKARWAGWIGFIVYQAVLLVFIR